MANFLCCFESPIVCRAFFFSRFAGLLVRWRVSSLKERADILDAPDSCVGAELNGLGKAARLDAIPPSRFRNWNDGRYRRARTPASFVVLLVLAGIFDAHGITANDLPESQVSGFWNICFHFAFPC